ncbi:MAG: hypothetical protein AAGI07_12680 [Bacteroidota bacterium]
MKINILFWLYGILFMFISGFTFWASSSDVKAIEEGKLLSSTINKHFAENPNKPLYLNKITAFNWDNIYIAGSYTDIERLEKTLEIHLTQLKSTGIEQHDDINLVLFFESNKLLKHITISRGILDFSTLSGKNITKENAVFSLSKNKTSTLTLAIK